MYCYNHNNNKKNRQGDYPKDIGFLLLNIIQHCLFIHYKYFSINLGNESQRGKAIINKLVDCLINSMNVWVNLNIREQFKKNWKEIINFHWIGMKSFIQDLTVFIIETWVSKNNLWRLSTVKKHFFNHIDHIWLDKITQFNIY